MTERTTNLPSGTTPDELLGHEDGSLKRFTFDTLTGDLDTRVTALETSLTSDSIAEPTWSALSAITGTGAGQKAEVYADAGTHTDPVVGGTVANAGVYTWSTSPAGWKWISADAVSTKASTTALSAETTRAEAAEALLAPLASPALTGTPTAPTPALTDSSTAINTTAGADAKDLLAFNTAINAAKPFLIWNAVPVEKNGDPGRIIHTVTNWNDGFHLFRGWASWYNWAGAAFDYVRTAYITDTPGCLVTINILDASKNIVTTASVRTSASYGYLVFRLPERITTSIIAAGIVGLQIYSPFSEGAKLLTGGQTDATVNIDNYVGDPSPSSYSQQFVQSNHNVVDILANWSTVGSPHTGFPTLIQLLDSHLFDLVNPDRIIMTPTMVAMDGIESNLFFQNTVAANLSSDDARWTVSCPAQQGLGLHLDRRGAPGSQYWRMPKDNMPIGSGPSGRFTRPSTLGAPTIFRVARYRKDTTYPPVDSIDFTMDFVSNTGAAAASKKGHFIGDSNMFYATSGTGTGAKSDIVARILTQMAAFPSAAQITFIGTNGASGNFSDGLNGRYDQSLYDNGSLWANNPFQTGSGVPFDYGTWMTNHSFTAPDFVFYMLGTNNVDQWAAAQDDYYFYTQTETALNYRDQVIGIGSAAYAGSIWTSAPSAKILMGLPIPVNAQQSAAALSSLDLRNRRDSVARGLCIFREAMLKRYFGVANIFLVPTHVCVDPLNMFSGELDQARSVDDTVPGVTEQNAIDLLHPAVTGHPAIGDHIYSFLNGLVIRSLL
jgi:hypothetical protein